MSRVRSPLDGLCPECREPVEEVVVTDSRSGPCVVAWPCRHQFPLDDRTDTGQRGSFTPLTRKPTP